MAVEHVTKGNADGTVFGQSASDKISFFNATPAVQRASATMSASLSLFLITGASVAAFATAQFSALWDAVAEIRNALVANGLFKGGA